MIDLGAYKDKFGDSGQRILEYALSESRRRDQNYVAVEHILKALADEEAELFNSTMRDLALDPHSVRMVIDRRLEMSRQHTCSPPSPVRRPLIHVRSRVSSGCTV